MRIAYLTQYFPPEIGAPSARVGELSAIWASMGHTVIVLTGLPNHPTGQIPPEYRRRVFCVECRDGVEIWRHWLFATPNQGFGKKVLSHLSFMASVAVLSTFRLRDVDVLVVSSPTFFSVIAAWFISRIRRIPFVFEVRDLWPAIFVDLGVLTNRLAIRLLETLEVALYRAAAKVVVVTAAFADHIARRGVPSSHIVTISNGVDPDFFSPGVSGADVRRIHGLEGRFVVLYIGAHGISHALHRILDAAAETVDEDEILWVFVGEGAQKADLIERARTLGLPNVRFVDGQPRAAMPGWYTAADLVLVPLRDVPLFSAFVPSKMFEVMASGRPIVGSVQGEARRILEASGAAWLTAPEDARGIAAAARALRADPERRRRMAEAGRRFVTTRYDRRVLAKAYLDVLESVAVRGRVRGAWATP